MHSLNKDSNRLRVLMFGPHLKATSGISNVVNNWLQDGLNEKIELHYIPTLKNYVPGRYVGKFFEAAVAYVLLAMTPQRAIDIVHIHMSSYMSFFRKWPIFMWAKLMRIKTVVHLHGSEFNKFFDESSDRIKWMITNVFDLADAIFVLSNSWKKFINGISTNKNIYVVYNGASLKKFSRKNRTNDRNIISFMGRLGQRKGVYDLLNAFEKLVLDVPDACLVLGGDGDVERVRKLVAQKNLKESISVLGWVTGEQKIRVFQECNIYVLPSYNEGLPGSILEAMAAGVPIISTPVGGIREVVIQNRNGYLVDPGNIDDLYNKMKILCRNEKLREKMGKESRKIIKEKFDIEKIVLDLVKIYHEVASK